MTVQNRNSEPIFFELKHEPLNVGVVGATECYWLSDENILLFIFHVDR